MTQQMRTRLALQGAAVAVAAGLLGGLYSTRSSAARGASLSLGADAQSVAQARGLTPDDITAALKTYMPSGRHDEYIMLSSGGHSGQMFVIGIPSMRLIREIAVFTPEPWQGWGYGAQGTMDTLQQGQEGNGGTLSWGDTHHPAISETGGEYDGQFCFINDKANARVAVIDLRDFETKQMVKNPLTDSDHGGTFVTPNTDWVVEGGQYGHPFGREYASMEEYREKYRGMITFWKFDRRKGRIDSTQSFAIELPPYWQDLSDAGKQVSEGWVFQNSFNTEMSTGGIEKMQPPFEAGASQRDRDYLHVFNLDKAVAVAQAGKVDVINGFSVIRLETAVKEGLLYFVPEPKSPHGVDVSPDGNYIVVSGKLDPHVTVYSFEKIQQAIAKGASDKDEYGVPILAFDDCMEAQVEVGLGPLHTQYDNQGYAYTSLFLDTAVARWTLGGAYQELHGEKPWSLISKIPVHYNVGHIATAEGDTVSPDGRYLVAMNKWSVDRFFAPGPLLPQNFQLIDIAEGGETMQLLYDMPIGVGEPHYAQIIKADKLITWDAYPEIGWDPHTQAVDPHAAQMGRERIERSDGKAEIWMTALRSHFNPEHIEIQEGDRVVWHITNVERAKDAVHGMALPAYNVNLSLEPGEAATVEFRADRSGVFPFYCSEFCSALHLEMMGYLMVKPAGGA